MAKEKKRYTCQQCGYQSVRWLGKCPDCGKWNSFVEEVEVIEKKSTRASAVSLKPAQKLAEISYQATARIDTGIGECNRVLGGGLVEGELVLLAGAPGIGKSTLTLQMTASLSQKKRVLYITGEESAQQIKLRAVRLAVNGENIYILAETNLEAIEAEIERVKPQIIILDSIQTVYLPELSSAPGSVSQLRECTGRMMHWAKGNGIATIVVGHVTKDGAVAGPRVLEHMVDAVLVFEGREQYPYRILRGSKNRFGSTNEVGIFEMLQEGLREVMDPSEVFLTERPVESSGSVVTSCMEGTRPLLVEIQALVSSSCLAQPRRTASGVDFNRLSLLLAVLEKRCGLRFGNQDAYVNVVGGLSLDEPAVDLAIVVALASSYLNKVVDKEYIVLGEVGLSGEIRQVSYIERRIHEAEKMGFRKAIVPIGNRDIKTSMQLVAVQYVSEALNKLLR